jgi:hypothetical protein
MRRILISVVCSLLVVASIPPALGAQYVQVTGQLTNYEGRSIGGNPDVVVARVSGAETIAQIDASGRYSLNLPAGVSTELIFVVYEPGYDDDGGSGSLKKPIRQNPGFSNWQTLIPSGLTENTSINLQLPKPIKINLTVTDAQSKALSNAVIAPGDSTHDTLQYGGHSWTGISRVQSGMASIFSSDGIFQLYFYPTSKTSLTYCQVQSLTYTQCSTGSVTTPIFSVLEDASYQLCLPINLGANNSTPPTCIDSVIAAKAAADKAAADKAAADKAAADKAAADKAAADKAAADKAAADKAAADEAAADKAAADKAAADALAAQQATERSKLTTLKKITITCVKGKLIKIVTGVKPTCPAGYKKK